MKSAARPGRCDRRRSWRAGRTTATCRVLISFRRRTANSITGPVLRCSSGVLLSRPGIGPGSRHRDRLRVAAIVKPASSQRYVWVPLISTRLPVGASPGTHPGGLEGFGLWANFDRESPSLVINQTVGCEANPSSNAHNDQNDQPERCTRPRRSARRWPTHAPCRRSGPIHLGGTAHAGAWCLTAGDQL